ncbi:MAG: hypothetical protein JW927_14230 [Deltaproteobacteria bacterium]|nr:hypothetical protein [Deltaproteobacteria bacterium]
MLWILETFIQVKYIRSAKQEVKNVQGIVLIVNNSVDAMRYVNVHM